MAGGLTLRQIRELKQQHGSLDAAIAARPDLADELRMVQEATRQAAATLRGFKVSVPSIPAFPNLIGPPRQPDRMPEIEDMIRARSEQRIHEFETALDRHARRQVEKPAKAKKRRRGPDPHPIPRAAFASVLALLENDEDLAEIVRLTNVGIHDVRKIRDWRNGQGFEVYPGPIPRTVVLRRL